MPLSISKETPAQRGERELVPAGTHAARCYSVVDFGHHLNTFNAEEQAYSHHVCITWELDVPMADGRPFVVSEWRRFRLPKTGWNEKSNLCRMLAGWLNVREMPSFKKLVGQSGMLTVVHNTYKDATYANFSSIVPLPKKLPAPDAVNTPIYFEIDPWDQAIFEKLPKWQREMIEESQEYKRKINGSLAANTSNDPEDDSIQF